MATASGNFVSQALQRRVKIAAGSPLLTWYHLPSGARVELSSKTTANWVDKSVNLFTSLDIEANPRVSIELLTSHPLHWSTLVWALAAWQAGGSVLDAADHADPLTVDVAVIGPTNAHPVPGVETIACSLHPLGMGFLDRPAGVTDAAQVLSEPDVHSAQLPVDLNSPFFNQVGGATITWAQAAAIEPFDGRIMVTAADLVDDRWSYLQIMLGMLRGSGSMVLVDGDSEASRLAEIKVQEKINI